MSVITKEARRLRRRRRVRAKVSGTAQRPRVSVFRSNRGISAQLIDDNAGRTLAAVNWTEAQLRALPAKERATRAGSSGSFQLGLPLLTLQNPQRRVHVSPRIMKVAVPRSQHSPTFGQAAS